MTERENADRQVTHYFILTDGTTIFEPLENKPAWQSLQETTGADGDRLKHYMSLARQTMTDEQIRRASPWDIEEVLGAAETWEYGDGS